MYYTSDMVQTAFKCNCCGQNFIDVVKVVPECGSSICGVCYEELKKRANAQTGQYQCRICAQRSPGSEAHILPKSGLADVQSIMMFLQFKPKVRGLTDGELVLKANIEDVQKRIERLRTFDEVKEINTYCDDLQKELRDSVEYGIKHLNKISEEFARQIEEYRESLLNQHKKPADEAAANVGPTAKRLKTETTVEKASEGMSAALLELETLAKDLERFNKTWMDQFTEISLLPAPKDVERATEQALEYGKRVKQIEIRLISVALDNKFLRLRDHQHFLRNKKIFGKLVYENSYFGNTNKEELMHTLTGHTDVVRRVMFLDNERLVSCSRDGTSKVWSLKTGEHLFDLIGHTNWVIAVTLLDNGLLATGSRDRTIKLWDLAQKTVVRTLTGHTNTVFSLKVLANGNLASAAFDNTVIIWNPNAAERNLVLKFTGHGTQNFPIDLNVLPNGNLVTCSNESDKENQIRIWNPETGALVKTINARVHCARSLLVMPHGRIVLGCLDGTIKLIDADNESDAKRLPIKLEGEVLTLMPLPDGRLLTAGTARDRSIKVWNLANGQPVQTILTGHGDTIFSLHVSSDGKYLASGSQDKTIKVWSLSS